MLIEQPEDLLGVGLCGVRYHLHQRALSLLASTDMKPDVRVVCASLSPIMTQRVLQRPREQL